MSRHGLKPLLKLCGELLVDFFELLFPNRCEACGTHLVQGEHIICLQCQAHLPKTYYWQQENNLVVQQFEEHASIAGGCAFLHTHNKGRYRKLLHKLKYQHLPQIGVLLGQMFGRELLTAPHFAGIDAIVPVPLHPKRQSRRGYNQSERIGCGMAQSMGVPLLENALLRRHYNETQTTKTYEERFANVRNIFCAGSKIQQLQGKHVLIVDDVLTTGATLGECIRTLQQNVDCRISVAALSVAK